MDDDASGEAVPEGCEHGMRWDRQCSACVGVMASDPLAEPGQEYRYNVEFRDGSRLGGLTWVEVQRHDGRLAQVWRVPVWPARVTDVAPTYRQIGWTIDTASGRLFETNITAEQSTRWQPVYITDGAAVGAKRLPMVPTNHMMNAAVNAWHSWKSRDSGGNVQLLGRLMWEHMADAAPDADVAPSDGGKHG